MSQVMSGWCSVHYLYRLWRGKLFAFDYRKPLCQNTIIPEKVEDLIRRNPLLIVVEHMITSSNGITRFDHSDAMRTCGACLSFIGLEVYISPWWFLPNNPFSVSPPGSTWFHLVCVPCYHMRSCCLGMLAYSSLIKASLNDIGKK